MSLFSYLVYTPDKRFMEFSLKTEPELIESYSQAPSRILMNFNRTISFHIYELYIDVVFLDQDDPSNHQIKRQNNPYQILTSFIWEDLLFYTDLYHVWLCLPTLVDREPLKIKLATVFPHSREPVGPFHGDQTSRSDFHRWTG